MEKVLYNSLNLSCSFCSSLSQICTRCMYTVCIYYGTYDFWDACMGNESSKCPADSHKYCNTTLCVYFVYSICVCALWEIYKSKAWYSGET